MMREPAPILYAEDSSNDVILTLEAFDEIGLPNRVDVVKDGTEVLEYLCYQGKYAHRQKENPLLILMDNKMPKLNGIEALKFIRAHKDLKMIPVVMFTSSRMERDIVDCYDVGANAYVVKPLGFVEFMDTIKRIGLFWGRFNKVLI